MGMMEEWNNGRMECWVNKGRRLGKVLPNIPMFDVLGCGFAALGSLWLDFDNTFNKGG